ncbi:tubulin monoglycylase TTLL3 isoform X3 [Mauremys reevesii]|uniref:tubulin monoglycylase TTLL3 isoform X3 n=1 Tax=Mauremys reevesii TaxID=260615 RepID=UPI00193FF253|nr:tubulin monoglycylase TTLL3 isoform X3 [Mauremys reevesii]
MLAEPGPARGCTESNGPKGFPGADVEGDAVAEKAALLPARRKGPAAPGPRRQRQEGLTAPPSDGRTRRSSGCYPLNPERLKQSRLYVERAVKQRKIFMLHGPYPVIRRLLRSRGWVEKKAPKAAHRWERVPEGEEDGEGDDSDGAEEDEEGEEEEEQDDDPDGTYDLMVGLCLNLRNLPWFDQADADTFFPRCYRLGAEDEKHAFIEDFWLTAARSILKVVVKKYWSSAARGAGAAAASGAQGPVKAGESAESLRGTGRKKASPLPPQLIETALQACEEHLSSLTHQDIDREPESPLCMMGARRGDFLRTYYQVIHEGALLEQLGSHVERCEHVLQRLAEVLPQLEMEGDRNIWIVKPGAKSRGRVWGSPTPHMLHAMRLLGAPRNHLHGPPGGDAEAGGLRPHDREGWQVGGAEIHRETPAHPRHQVRPAAVVPGDGLEPAHHLVLPRQLPPLLHAALLPAQPGHRHYENSLSRHPQLPPDNMWSSQQFQAHLQQAGAEGAWQEVIVPGMKAAIIHTMQTSQDVVEFRKSSFELYGADFMFGENCQPWLIEINASPTMAASTAVTSRLCASVQDDTLRVVIDRKHDRSCHTGAFELIYKQAAVDVPQYVGISLLVEGSTVKKPRPPNHRLSPGASPRTGPSVPSCPQHSQALPQSSPRGPRPPAPVSGKENRARELGAPNRASAAAGTRLKLPSKVRAEPGKRLLELHSTATSPLGDKLVPLGQPRFCPKCSSQVPGPSPRAPPRLQLSKATGPKGQLHMRDLRTFQLGCGHAAAPTHPPACSPGKPSVPEHQWGQAQAALRERPPAPPARPGQQCARGWLHRAPHLASAPELGALHTAAGRRKQKRDRMCR